jgi:hypothetical protein
MGKEKNQKNEKKKKVFETESKAVKSVFFSFFPPLFF